MMIKGEKIYIKMTRKVRFINPSLKILTEFRVNDLFRHFQIKKIFFCEQTCAWKCIFLFIISDFLHKAILPLPLTVSQITSKAVSWACIQIFLNYRHCVFVTSRTKILKSILLLLSRNYAFVVEILCTTYYFHSFCHRTDKIVQLKFYRLTEV